MVNNPPANQLFGTCIEMPGCDRISELPDHLLTHILSYLPTKDSGKTSVLSKRWKNLWLSVPVLDVSRWEFHYGEDDVILSVVDRLLEFDTATRLLEVKVNYFSLKIDGLKDRISTVIKRGPQHLEYESCTYYIDGPDDETYPYVDFMPLNLYTSKTLVSLKLKFSGLEDPGFVCMPCLKSMTLAEVRFREDVILEKLVSGCPVLEELTLARDMDSSLVGEVDRFMRVRSGSLKRFCVPYWHGNDCNTLAKCTLEIDAPRLERMVFEEDQFDSILVKNLTSLFMVDLNISFHHYFCPPCDLSQKENFRDFFLSGISSVRHMIISKKTMEALDYYSYDCSIPKFINLSRLDVVVPCNSLQFLSAFLECCPNLKHLILEVHYLREMDYRFELTRVPKSTSNGVTHHWSP